MVGRKSGKAIFVQPGFVGLAGASAAEATARREGSPWLMLSLSVLSTE
ncbi:MAG: hypothetical protein RMJ19_02045 [Gemmatales bacterium]|nr:hypothetical protein [Gemmatales bacterium]MDW8174428.1 hypothetical protein [Gemmatales bacterium]MDW8222265.1 hypothetical protein [Gemmatales bacterium]